MPIDAANDRSNFLQAVQIEMLRLLHMIEHFSKQLEILPFGRPQWVLTEKGDNPLPKIPDRPDAKTIKMFFMVIVSAVYVNAAAAKELLQRFQCWAASRSLSYNELRKHLPTKLHHSATLNGDGEAALSIDKPNDPTNCLQPFLLMICIQHVVTAFA